MAEIAIIVPAFLRDEQALGWFEEAIASVRAQAFQGVEIVVVDDNGPVRVPRGDYKLLRQDGNCGPGAARNLAVQASRAPWLLPLDCDDRLLPGALEMLYAARCERGLIYGDLEWIGDRLGYQRLDDFNLNALIKLRGPMPVTALHNRSAWSDVGGWSEGWEGLEDIEYAIRLTAAGVCGQRIDYTTLQYRRHADSRQASLEANDRARLKVVHERIQQKHATLWSKLSMATCDKCPGGSPAGQGVLMAENGIENGVALKYVGAKLASFFETSPATGVRYRVEGRGTWLKAHPSDVNWFLAHQYGGQAEYIVDQVAPPPAFSIASRPMPLASVPDITTLTPEAAKTLIAGSTDKLDLRVWLAEENGSGAPRKEVMAAIQARLKAI